MRKLPSCLLGAIFVVGVASTTVNAVDGNPPGFFELDENILASSAPGDDWGLLFAGGGSAVVTTNDDDPDSPTSNTPIVTDTAPKSIFTQGGSKDVNDVSEWKHTDGAVPDKDDITHAYAAGYNVAADICLNSTAGQPAVLCSHPDADTAAVVHEAGDLIVYFGLDRFANNGDANAGFWFFQNEVFQDAGGTFVDGDGDPAIHAAKTATSPGDVFVIVKYPQGSGAIPIIKAYEWDPNDADNDGNDDPSEKGGKFSPLDLLIDEENALCDGLGGKLACAITNSDDLPLLGDPDPIPWPYTPKSGTGLPHESFYEGGINVSQLLGSTPCFASFLAETRSSESQSAQLKDFVLSSFPVCGAEVTKDCTAAVVGNVATVSFDGNALNTGAQSVFIKLEDDSAGAVFDSVCFDNNNDEVCDVVVPAAPTDLTLGATATFTLGAGERVFYQGHYTESPVTSLSFSDTVTLSFFSDSSQGTLLGTDTDPASCSATVTPDVEITKICDPDIGGGSGVRLVVDGGKVVVEVGNIITVHNNGQEALENVTISDTDVLTLVKSSGGTNLTCTAGTGQCTGDLALDETVVLKQTYKPDGLNITGDLLLPNSVFFNNEASAQGQGVLSGATTDLVKDDASCELCPADPIPD